MARDVSTSLLLEQQMLYLLSPCLFPLGYFGIDNYAKWGSIWGSSGTLCLLPPGTLHNSDLMGSFTVFTGAMTQQPQEDFDRSVEDAQAWMKVVQEQLQVNDNTQGPRAALEARLRETEVGSGQALLALWHWPSPSCPG